MKHHYYTTPNISLTAKDYREIKTIFDSGWVCTGRYVQALEGIFKIRFNTKYAIACSSATTGLTLSVKAAEWKNKRVLLPSFTWPSTLFAVESNDGNVPVFGDINRDTWLMEVGNQEYDTVIAVDTFGSKVKCHTSLPIIYDAAHGFDLPGLGHRGLAEVVSLSFTKVVTAVQGGIILTEDDEFAEKVQELVRLAGKMEEVNALVAIKSIENYDKKDAEIRLAIIGKYVDELKKVEYQKILEETNNSVFAVLFKSSEVRDKVRDELLNAGFETKLYYEPLVKGMPNTDYIFSRILALPVYKNIRPFQDKIIGIINRNV